MAGNVSRTARGLEISIAPPIYFLCAWIFFVPNEIDLIGWLRMLALCHRCFATLWKYPLWRFEDCQIMVPVMRIGSSMSTVRLKQCSRIETCMLRLAASNLSPACEVGTYDCEA